MATLSSTSSISEIRAAYIDNADYEAAGSVAQAQAFVQACRILLLVLPLQTAQDRGSTTFSPQLIKQELETARLWLALNPGSRGGGTGRYIATDNARGAGGVPADDQCIFQPDVGGG